MFDYKSPKERKDEKRANQQKDILEAYGLDAIANPEDAEAINLIVDRLRKAGLGSASIEGLKAAGGHMDIIKMQLVYQRAQVEQNFIMIRQLDRIARLLEK